MCEKSNGQPNVSRVSNITDLSNAVIRHHRKSTGSGVLEYLTFKPLEAYSDRLTHCFTTRRGGVSTGLVHSLNLGFNRGDVFENVVENYHIIGRALDIEPEKLFFSRQEHGKHVGVVNEAHNGNWLVRRDLLNENDGLATATAGKPLITFYADCVPVMLYDPVKNAMALVHSGWRSTVQKIGAVAVDVMCRNFSSRPQDIIACIGPSIGPCCFEVDRPVVDIFEGAFGADTVKIAAQPDKPGKYHIDLWDLNQHILLCAGLMQSNIHCANICTVCHKEIFFSHRGDEGKTGSLALIAQLR